MNRAGRILSLLVALVFATGAAAPDVRAEGPDRDIVLAQAEGERQGVFRFLFGKRRPRYVAPQQLMPQQPADTRQQARPRKQRDAAKPRRQREAARPRRQRTARPQAAAPAREVAAVEKAANAKRVVVIGDFMASALFKGLTDAYAQNPNVVMVDANNGSSGLVRQDHYDWPGSIPGLVEKEKPDAILALVGANDRQAIGTTSGAQALGSEGWRMAYGGRVAALADALKATGKPILWAGLPPVRSGAMSRDYSAFNSIVREQLDGKGLRFIDVWNGFANEEGKFVASGPDVSGQPAQLRDSDGLNFTRAGQRKLAFFVERELNDILGGVVVPQLVSTDPTAAGAAVTPAVIYEGPKIGPMVPIEALSAAGGTALSGPTPAAATSGFAATTIAKRLSGDEKAMPPAGRTDNYIWPVPASP